MRLSYDEAKAKLSTLTSESEEYALFQQALIKGNGIFEFCFNSNLYKIDKTTTSGSLLGGFGSCEHIAIGEGVVLGGIPSDTPLLLKDDSVMVFFKHIVALAGDFYALYGQAISLLGGSVEDKTARFVASFESLAQAEAGQIRGIMDQLEDEYIQVKNSGHPHHCYGEQMIERSFAIKKIKADIDDLLIDNSDHFSINAIDAYQIGHCEAMRIAKLAGKDRNLDGLKYAYALDAFACHFLTDVFASGHIRNQRGDLEIFLIKKLDLLSSFSLKNVKKLAGLLTGAQHEKDGKEGLNVCNKKGENWRAYGDGCFFTPKNSENQKKAIEAVQASVDEIYNAYENPLMDQTSHMELLIPQPTDVNPPPLYEVVDQFSLFLYEDHQKVEIQTTYEYLSKGIPQALKHLPESYINGFIDGALTPNIPIPGFIQNGKIICGKIVAPRMERVMGTLWHIVGIATYYQVKCQAEQLGAKISEVAEGVMAIHENTVQILKRLDEISSEQDLRDSIGKAIHQIKDGAHEFEQRRGKFDDPKRLQLVANQLFNGYIRLSRIFTRNGKSMFDTYSKTLMLSGPEEKKMRLTLWFRQILDYQTVAFGFYLALMQQQNKDGAFIQTEASLFQSAVLKQLQLNTNWIYDDLIQKPQNEIIDELANFNPKKVRHSSETQASFLVKTHGMDDPSLYSPGLNLEGNCLFGCEVSRHEKIYKKGLGDYNIGVDSATFSCISCSKIVSIQKLIFWNCTFSIEGSLENSHEKIRETGRITKNYIKIYTCDGNWLYLHVNTTKGE